MAKFVDGSAAKERVLELFPRNTSWLNAENHTQGPKETVQGAAHHFHESL
jgi:hypothetical protein